ncbi:hypothetical protein CVT26_002551 [Gymnopilus dilepis]|uniref:Ribonuclease H1 N-terminal domain-containing protein n=1 Tax=Gymnopilus dilepis TaxID=231916 RepID=A0A409Y3R8_9AGAR|nr:hypothetical protein CVT26_002551 [Gymnopilus dilepis]
MRIPASPPPSPTPSESNYMNSPPQTPSRSAADASEVDNSTTATPATPMRRRKDVTETRTTHLPMKFGTKTEVFTRSESTIEEPIISSPVSAPVSTPSPLSTPSKGSSRRADRKLTTGHSAPISSHVTMQAGPANSQAAAVRQDAGAPAVHGPAPAAHAAGSSTTVGITAYGPEKSDLYIVFIPRSVNLNVYYVKEYLPAHPSTLKRFAPGRTGKVFILYSGTKSGLYPNWSDALAASPDFNVIEGRPDWDSAYTAYCDAYKRRLMFILPSPKDQTTNDNYVYRALPKGFDNKLIDRSYPSVAELRSTLPVDAEAYYVVEIGEQVGVFTSWLEAGSRTQFARALGKYTKYKGYDTFEEAMVAYEALVAAKTLRVKPIRGGRFDSRLTLPPFPEC